MRLTKAGIIDDRPDPETWAQSLIRPATVSQLFDLWHDPVRGIDEDFTLGDLFALLRGVDDIAILSPLLGCDVPAFLAETHPVTDPILDDHSIQYLVVSNVANLDHYEPDPTIPDEPLEWLDADEADEQDRVDAGVASLTGGGRPYRVVDATGDDPVTGEPVARHLRLPPLHGSWQPPYHIHREFGGWGRWHEPYDGYFAAHPDVDPRNYEGGIAVEFTPLPALQGLPVRYRTEVQFRSRSAGGDERVLFDTHIAITFGELVRAIFWEIGFFGTPACRDEMRSDLRARADAIDRKKTSDDAHSP